MVGFPLTGQTGHSTPLGVGACVRVPRGYALCPKPSALDSTDTPIYAEPEVNCYLHHMTQRPILSFDPAGADTLLAGCRRFE
jgi:hypothetical protein